MTLDSPMPVPVKSALVLDANTRGALAVTRSLGRRGIRVFTADETASSLAGSSRYSYRFVRYPSARNEEDRFVDTIAETCAQHQIDFLLPLTELTSSLLLGRREEFENIILPFADAQTVASLANKCKLAGLARELGIPFPGSLEIAAGRVPEDELSRHAYPLVLKPGLSWLRTDRGWIHTSVRVAHSGPEAIRLIEEEASFKHHDFLIQEYVAGHGMGIFAVYDHGDPIAFFAHRRLREKPADGGVSVLCESIDPDPLLLGYARKLLDHVRWHGAAMVEFRVAQERIYLMEVNTRFWGSLQLAIDCGVDFPWLLYRLSHGESIDRIGRYRTGRRLRWLQGDIRRLILLMSDDKKSFGYKIGALVQFLTPHPRITRFDILRWSDLNPFYWEIRRNFRKLSGHDKASGNGFNDDR